MADPVVTFHNGNDNSAPQWRWREMATFAIALIVVVGFFVFLFNFWSGINKDQQGMIIGALLGIFGSAVGYYVNSSVGSAAKSAEGVSKP